MSLTLTTLTNAEQYIENVVAGRVVASEWVKLQCERHKRDLVDGAARGLVFDRTAAELPIRFFHTCLVHPKESDLAGQPFLLDPHQQALIWILYGWQWMETGNRRFKVAYVEQGAGNGKSALVSGLGVFDLMTTSGAEVYAAATDKATAHRIVATAASMVRGSPALKSRVKLMRSNMHVVKTASKFEPVCSEDKNIQGLRPTFVALDELWKHSTAGVWDAFYARLDKRKDGLLFAITNSGWDRESVCYKKREYSIKVLQGIIPDDTWFGWICGLGEKDAEGLNWLNETNWIKANPLLGSVVSLDGLRQQAQAAAADSSLYNGFLQARLGVWTSSHSAWMPMNLWDACNDPVDAAILKGRQCFGGLDLSTTIDISAFVLLFPPYGDDLKWRILPFFFLPEENIEERVKKDRVPYDHWQRAGLFNLTPGNIIDTQFVKRKIAELAEQYQIVEIGYDKALSADITPQLEEMNLKVVPISQSGVGTTPAVKKLKEMVMRGEIAHGSNPVLRWMASNVVVREGSTGLFFIDKSKSREKIDGISATIDALSRAMVVPITQFDWMPFFVR